MIRFALLLFMSLGLSSHADAAVKWNNSGGSSNTNEAWIPEIKTQLHDLDISNAKFNFVNEQLEKSLALFPENEFKFWGTQVVGADVGGTKGAEQRTVDCELILQQMRPPSGADWDAPMYFQNCSYHYRQNLFNGGLSFFQNILDYWAEKGADSYPIDKSSSSDGYSKRNAVASLTTTYALFYNHFNNHKKINNFINNWLLANQTIVKPNKKRCPVEFPPLYRKQPNIYSVDSCGSNNWRTAVAAIAFGLRTNSKDAYIAGVKQFEINISMYDDDGIFVPYASRGWDAPGYAIDNDEYISALAILFNDIDFDLYQLKVKNGQTVADLTIGHTNWLETPSIAEKYILGTLTCNGGVCKPFTNFSQAGSLAQWKIDRQFEAHDIQLRQLYYLFRQKKYSPSDIEEVALNFPYSETLPHMYIFGQTSSFPHIFITLNQVGRLESYLEKSLGSKKVETPNEDKPVIDLETLQSKLDNIKGFQGRVTCDLQITRTLKSTGENNIIMSGRALIESGSIQFADINWQTGNNQNWEDISTKQNLVIAEDGKLIGVIPIFTMFGNDTWELFELGNDFEKYGKPATPQGINKSEVGDVQLEFELMFCAE